MQKKAFSFAVGALLLSAGAVSAATLTDNLNLRSGPGLRYDDVIGAVPAGSDVRVMNCVGSWCRVAWNDTQGYVSRRFISRGGPVYAASPTTGYIAPRYGAMGTVTATRRPRVRPGHLTRVWVTAGAGGIADTNTRGATT